jgi:hypothetical protein
MYGWTTAELVKFISRKFEEIKLELEKIKEEVEEIKNKLNK